MLEIESFYFADLGVGKTAPFDLEYFLNHQIVFICRAKALAQLLHLDDLLTNLCSDSRQFRRGVIIALRDIREALFLSPDERIQERHFTIHVTQVTRHLLQVLLELVFFH